METSHVVPCLNTPGSLKQSRGAFYLKRGLPPPSSGFREGQMWESGQFRNTENLKQQKTVNANFLTVAQLENKVSFWEENSAKRLSKAVHKYHIDWRSPEKRSAPKKSIINFFFLVLIPVME